MTKITHTVYMCVLDSHLNINPLLNKQIFRHHPIISHLSFVTNPDILNALASV